MEVQITLKSGNKHQFDMQQTYTREAFIRMLSRKEFIYLGPMILNTREIESIQIM